MESVKSTREISDFYEKYLIAIRIDDSTHYLVWGAALTDNGNDEILLDSANKYCFLRVRMKLYGLV
ncbi:hypothetical protein [Spirosoma flavum]|uniref:Uncharacterized protein n=1 Tax=Spirosoma flavum TaxID=2048557 RepID=A0ABW6AH08_9BACT